MNHIPTSPATHNRRPLRVLQVIFTVLASGSLVLGSLLLSLIWLGINVSLSGLLSMTISPEYALEGKMLSSLFLLPLTLLAFGLFGTVALLTAKRWVAAGLALPTAIAILIGLYLFVVFVMPRAPSLVFVVLLLMLNAGVLWLAWRFLTSTSR